MNLIITCIIAILLPIPGKITPELADILNKSSLNQQITVIVHMNTEYPAERLKGLDIAERAAIMKDIARSSQRDIVQYIAGLSTEKAVMGGQYWIFNGFHLKATRDVIKALAERDDVWFICENGIVQLPPNEPVGPYPAVAEWNIQKVMADSCWQAGYSGDSVVLGFLDTGMLTTHEALAGKWLSPYWLDAINGQAAPYDDNGHGTAVCGVICGGDGPGPLANDIGVAYGAKVIPTKAFSSGGGATYESIDSCLQYLADLRISGVKIRAINNSWGSGGAELHWWNIMLSFKMIGVLPAAAVGSSGPGSGTVGVPASYPTVIASGATDASDVIASFSSRGPAPDQDPWNDSTYWYYSNWNLLKPDVSAPGVNIRTSTNNGGYVTYSGASFAIPHVTGGVALFCDKDSALTVADLYYLFRAYCDEPAGGGTYPNNNYGWGRINLWRAMQAITGIEEAGSLTDAKLSLAVCPTISRGNIQITYRAGIRSAIQFGGEGSGLRIYDITGCLVKDLSSFVSRPSSSILWLGDDDEGRAVPAGVYFVKLACGTDQITEKAVILR